MPQLDEGITECQWLPLGDAVSTVSYANARDVLIAAARVLESPFPR